jgi:Tfp pilus assembly protein PilX
MKTLIRNDRGYAMVVALSFIAGLTLLAVIIITVSISEKRTAFNEYSHSRSFYAADAGGEAAINWLRIQNSPPNLLDAQKHVFVPTGYDTLTDDHKYRFDVTYIKKKTRVGWSHDYKDFEYTIDADGTSVKESESEVEVQVRRLFKEGY